MKIEWSGIELFFKKPPNCGKAKHAGPLTRGCQLVTNNIAFANGSPLFVL